MSRRRTPSGGVAHVVTGPRRSWWARKGRSQPAKAQGPGEEREGGPEARERDDPRDLVRADGRQVAARREADRAEEPREGRAVEQELLMADHETREPAIEAAVVEDVV